MEELRVPKGVYTSTLAVNSDTHGQVVDETYRFTGRHLTVYDATKAEAHRIAEAFIAKGLPLVIVQPGLIYGPGDTSGVRTTFIEFLKRKLPALPKKTAYCWGYIDDVARAHILAMEKGRAGRNYFICGPVHTLIEAIDVASEITGIPAPKIHIPPSFLKIGAVPGAARREHPADPAGVHVRGPARDRRDQLHRQQRPRDARAGLDRAAASCGAGGDAAA